MPGCSLESSFHTVHGVISLSHHSSSTKISKMKSKSLQDLVLFKHQNGKKASAIFAELEGSVSLPTIKRWLKMISKNGSIDLKTSSGRKRTASSSRNIRTVKRLSKGEKKPTIRNMTAKLGISYDSTWSILRKDLGLYPYKIRTEPRLSDDQKKKRVKFCHWVNRTFRKSDTKRIVFSDEKRFNIHGVYNSQNERIWAVDRAAADKNGGIHQKRKFPQEIMVWLAACSKGYSRVVIVPNGTLDSDYYVKNFLPVAKKYGDKLFGNDWTYQQDGATPHTAAASMEWCRTNLPGIIDKDRWPANSPDLNPLDYSVWNEYVHAINWNKVTSKKALEKELQVAVKRISKDKVMKSCISWTNRFYRMWKKNGDYL